MPSMCMPSIRAHYLSNTMCVAPAIHALCSSTRRHLEPSDRGHPLWHLGEVDFTAVRTEVIPHNTWFSDKLGMGQWLDLPVRKAELEQNNLRAAWLSCAMRAKQ
eukprot:scaffold144196_cov15-Tisochrysis_lutea.AAC.1